MQKVVTKRSSLPVIFGAGGQSARLANPPTVARPLYVILKRTIMRKIILGVAVSLDGFIEGRSLARPLAIF